MEIWPESVIPKPTVSFQNQTAGSVIRSKMNSGVITQRRRFSVELNTYSTTWQLTEEQRSVFRKFFRDKISHGADKFNITLPVGDGNDFTAVVARFTSGGYSEQYKDFDAWILSATLECSTVEVTPTP